MKREALNGKNGNDMKDVKWVKKVESLNRGKTVETVMSPTEGCSTSLKRGVNEMCSKLADFRPSKFDAQPSTFNGRRAFTLIELLVVIAIMAVLAALIIPITGVVTRHKLRSRTKAELNLIASAIQNYKSQKGYYPPDNPRNGNFLNQLYYELSGTTYNNGLYTTLDGNSTLNPALISGPLYGKGFQGIVNTTKGGGDEGMAAQKYIRDLKPAQVAELKSGVKILVGSVGWENPASQWVQVSPGGPALKPGLAPICYVSTNPTNNPNSFDLWIDIMVQGRTNRICNWSDDPIVY